MDRHPSQLPTQHCDLLISSGAQLSSPFCVLVLAPWWLHCSLLGLGSLPSWCFGQSRHAYFFLVERYVISERKPPSAFAGIKPIL